MKIIYEDKNIIVIDKPVGIDSEHGVPQKIAEAAGISADNVFTVHRLDRDVGGLMVYAKNRETAASLGRAIENGEFVKEYSAKIHGEVEPEGRLEDFLFKDSSKNKVFVVKKERKGVKKAALRYNTERVETLEDGEKITTVHIVLETGRTHQIRVQFASRKNPLVGDKKYGAKDNEKQIALKSVKISFPSLEKNSCGSCSGSKRLVFELKGFDA